MERERSREKYPMTNKSHSLLLFSSRTATVFSLQFFSMIYQAMNQVTGLPDSLLTSQKENIHVRNIKPQWAITHLSQGREHPASLCNEDGSHCTRDASASLGTKSRMAAFSNRVLQQDSHRGVFPSVFACIPKCKWHWNDEVFIQRQHWRLHNSILVPCPTWTPLPFPPVQSSQKEGWSLFPVSWWGGGG